MKYLLSAVAVLLTVFALNVFAGISVPSPDTDKDGIPDYFKCQLEDDGVHCEDPVDNCPSIKNSRQTPSVLDTEEEPLGVACDYDLNMDGVVNSTDYTYLRIIVNISTSTGVATKCNDCTGDMDDDGYVWYPDICMYLNRNPHVVAVIPFNCL